ncbi:wax ester/triacylglycerol synthase family O-acyltransferase [Saccharopolyspora flava]|nr:wax ester/triacylglycerol synthase family O-acyltransferase [Saccharopolyspora flava]
MTATETPARSELTPLDWAFLCMENEDTPMHVGAVAVFRAEGPVDRDRLRRLLAERAQRIGRLRMRLERSWLQPHWREARDFDATEHVHDHEVPSPGGREELAILTSELIADPLDQRRPLWELHLITGLADNRFAVLMKFHHALVDGHDAVEVGVRLLDEFTDLTDTPATPPSNPIEDALGLLRKPDKLVGALRGTLSKSGESLGIAASVVRHVRIPLQSSPMHASTSPARKLALVPVDLADIRRIRSRHGGGTTNDVVLAIITGALRRWMADRGADVGGVPVRALIPVCRRRSNQPRSGNNQLSGYLCGLPVDEPDPGERLRSLREEMSANKSGGPLRGPGAFPVLAGRLPQLLHHLATPLVAQGAPLLFDTMVTNVPLPRFHAALDGAEVAELFPIAPLASGHALSIAVSQFRDTVHIGVQANRAALPDMEKLAEALPQAVAELCDGA